MVTSSMKDFLIFLSTFYISTKLSIEISVFFFHLRSGISCNYSNFLFVYSFTEVQLFKMYNLMSFDVYVYQ